MVQDVASPDCWESRVRDAADISFICRYLAAEAKKLGFDDETAAYIDIAVTELATNILNHRAKNGRIQVTGLNGAINRGLQIVALDDGPGIANINQALKDRFSDKGSMGCGLGAVQRLMDEFDIYSRPEDYVPENLRNASPCGGTIALARKWTTPPIKNVYSWGGATRPHPGYQANGDAMLIRELEGRLVVAVIDGLGHGEDAETASQMALNYVEDNIERPFLQLMPEMHDKLKGTRGVVISLISLDLETHLLSWLGLGNVEIRIMPRPIVSPFPKPGVLGYGRLPRLQLTEIRLPDEFTLVLYSDGITERWSKESRPDLVSLPAALLSHCLLREYSRSNDDATVVVIKGNPGL